MVILWRSFSPPWTVSSADSFASTEFHLFFFSLLPFLLFVCGILFSLWPDWLPSLCATPFLFLRLPHSSPSLFFHFVIFLLIQKGSETDNLLLCYDDQHEREEKDEEEATSKSRCWRLFFSWAPNIFANLFHPAEHIHHNREGGLKAHRFLSHPPYNSAEKHDGILFIKLWYFFLSPLANGLSTRSESFSIFTRHPNTNR